MIIQYNLSPADFNSLVNPNLLVASFDISKNTPKKGVRIYRKSNNTLFIDKIFTRESTAKTFLKKILGEEIKEHVVKVLNAKNWWHIDYDTRANLLYYRNPALWKAIYDEFEFRKI